MSILFARERRDAPTGYQGDMIERRPVNSTVGTVAVTPSSALRMSAVWACLRLRANLESSTPLDVFRRTAGVQVEVPKPALLTAPGGPNVSLPQWLWSSRFDLDRYGNCFGLISARDGLGLPRQVDLWENDATKVITRGREITGYQYDGVRYDPGDVWHEKQYTVPGIPFGLSPIAQAAWSIGGYLSAQQFALQWFSGGAFPAGVLKNTEESELAPEVRAAAKSSFKASVANHEPFVTGAEWEWSTSNVDAAGAAFLEEMKYGVADIARFFDVPGDLIGAETSSGSITYANVSQRMLQVLITSIGPMYVHREAALSAAVPGGRFVKFNSDALLRMDPETRSRVINGQVMSRRLAPSEARAIDNLPPFTPDQIAEFDLLEVPLAKPKTQGAVE